MSLIKPLGGYWLGLLLCLFASQCLAAGVLKLSRTELILEPGKHLPQLDAENIGDTPLYLEVEQQQLLNPGLLPEHLLPIGKVQRPSLLVAPDRLVLAPGQKRRMTLRVLATPAQTRVWRLTFRPKERLQVDTQTRAAPLVLSVGYGVVIYQLGADD